MQRIDTSDGHWVGGDPATNTKGTTIRHWWLETFQEEMVAIVTGLGGSLDPALNNQIVTLLLASFATANACQNNIFPKALTTGGTANAVTATFSPSITDLSDGMILSINPSLNNTSGSATFTPKPGTITPAYFCKGTNKALLPYDYGGAWINVQWQASLGKWRILNPLLGVYGEQTAASDPTFADNSVLPASTNWVRGAMASISTAAGSAVSLSTTNGSIKLPSWLGGLILKWVKGATDVAGTSETTQNLTYATAFPTASLAEWVGMRVAGTTNATDIGYSTFSPTTTGCSIQRQIWLAGQTLVDATPILFAIGY